MYFRYMLTPDEINIFSSMGKTKEYDAGAILFYEDTVADNFYIILDGLVKGGRFGLGKENIFHFFLPKMMVGEVSFREECNYPLTTIFVTKGKVLLVNREAIYNTKQNISDFDTIFIRSIIGKVRYLQNSINTIASADAKVRTAIFLLEHRYWISNISIKEIASVLNTTRETVSRSIAYFIREKALSKVGNKIEIIDSKILALYISNTK